MYTPNQQSHENNKFYRLAEQLKKVFGRSYKRFRHGYNKPGRRYGRRAYITGLKSGQAHTVKKIAAILEDIAAHPYTGIGKPEALKYELSGMWSRRINAEHRIIYKVLGEVVEVQIMSMRYHYVKA